MPRKKVEVKKVGAVKAPVEKVEAPTPPPAPVKPKCFVIAPGKSCTSLKGIVGPGKEVVPEDFNGGQKTFDKWVTRGFIVESNK